jgi:hypothetical protein
MTHSSPLDAHDNPPERIRKERQQMIGRERQGFKLTPRHEAYAFKKYPDKDTVTIVYDTAMARLEGCVFWQVPSVTVLSEQPISTLAFKRCIHARTRATIWTAEPPAGTPMAEAVGEQEEEEITAEQVEEIKKKQRKKRFGEPKPEEEAPAEEEPDVTQEELLEAQKRIKEKKAAAGPPAAEGKLLDAKGNLEAPKPEAGKSLLSRWRDKKGSIPGSAEAEAKKTAFNKEAEAEKAFTARSEERGGGQKRTLRCQGEPCAKEKPTTSNRPRRDPLRIVS